MKIISFPSSKYKHIPSSYFVLFCLTVGTILQMPNRTKLIHGQMFLSAILLHLTFFLVQSFNHLIFDAAVVVVFHRSENIQASPIANTHWTSELYLTNVQIKCNNNLYICIEHWNHLLMTFKYIFASWCLYFQYFNVQNRHWTLASWMMMG